MPAPSSYDVDPPERWSSVPPASPPYVDGPLRLADPSAAPTPRPLDLMLTAVAQPVAPPPNRRGLVAVVAALAAMLFIASFAVTRYAVTDTASISAEAPPAATSSPTTVPATPSAPRRTPPTTTPPTTTPSSPSDDGSSPSAPSTGSNEPTPDLSDQVTQVTPGVVNIVSVMPAGVGAGTGIVVSAGGDVITNNHVIEGATQIQATIANTGETYAATVVGTDEVHDVAVIHLAAAQDLVTVPIGDSDEVRVGDAVAAVGNAGGLGGAPKVATGRVTALHESVTAADEAGGDTRTLTDLIEVDAFVQSGDSGGPLVSEDAEVIGIDVAASVTTSGGANQPHVGFAIPINRVMSIADEIRANPSPPAGSNGPTLGSGYLGVAAVDATSIDGASITSVQPKSPAADAGLEPGDVITEVDSAPITSSDGLVKALAGYQGGEQATITWQSSSGERQATVTLASR